MLANTKFLSFPLSRTTGTLFLGELMSSAVEEVTLAGRTEDRRHLNSNGKFGFSLATVPSRRGFLWQRELEETLPYENLRKRLSSG